MAKPNYQFEKRQRDLAKKKKQEEKRLQKLADKAAVDAGGQPSAAQPEADDATAPDADGETTPKA